MPTRTAPGLKKERKKARDPPWTCCGERRQERRGPLCSGVRAPWGAGRLSPPHAPSHPQACPAVAGRRLQYPLHPPALPPRRLDHHCPAVRRLVKSPGRHQVVAVACPAWWVFASPGWPMRPAAPAGYRTRPADAKCWRQPLARRPPRMHPGPASAGSLQCTSLHVSAAARLDSIPSMGKAAPVV